MPDPLSAGERYRSDAVKLFELAKDAPNPFFRDYYKRLPQRYLMHAENQERIAWISEGSTTGSRKDDPMPDSPCVQAAPAAVSPEEASASAQSASAASLQAAQDPDRAPRRKRRRRLFSPGDQAGCGLGLRDALSRANLSRPQGPPAAGRSSWPSAAPLP